MSGKRVHEYEIMFKHLKNNKGEPVSREPLLLNFENHDDVSAIIDLLSGKAWLDKDQVVQLVLGLKLFGDILMKNRDRKLFSEMQPAFVAFMKKLKEEVKAES